MAEEHRRYDSRMIEDFIAHLNWELRASHFDQTRVAGSTAVHPELAEMVSKYVKRYRCMLLPLLMLRRRGETDAEWEKMKEDVRRQVSGTNSGSLLRDTSRNNAGRISSSSLSGNALL